MSKEKQFKPHYLVGEMAEKININVLGLDNTVLRYRVKKHVSFRKLMRIYSQQTGVALGVLRFRMDGQPVNESDSPAALDVEDGDTIEVYVPQTGGWKEYSYLF